MIYVIEKKYFFAYLSFGRMLANCRRMYFRIYGGESYISDYKGCMTRHIFIMFFMALRAFVLSYSVLSL